MSWRTRDTKDLLSASGRSMLGGVRDGDPGVFYDDQGRLYYQGDRPDDRLYPSASLPPDMSQYKHELRPDDTLTYDPRKTNSESRDPRSWKWSRDDTTRSSGRSNIITKHYDSYRKAPKMNYNNYPGRVIQSGNGFSQDTVVGDNMKGRRIIREGSIMIEEHIVSHERPWLWPLYLIVGLLLFMIGILNAILCTDNHGYVDLWVPIVILIYAVSGAVHKGIYRGKGGKWRNVFHIVAGCVATLFVFLALGFVMMRLDHVTLQITENGASGFIFEEETRMTRYNELPRVKLGSSYAENLWACYSMDWVAMALFILCFAILTSTLIIANNYYNSNYEYRREVEPFCKPQLFNPYGQASLGQAMAFVGIVLKTAAHGNVDVEWQDYWVSVWTAIFPMVAGPVTAIALKRVGLRKGKTLVALALFLQFLCFLAAVSGFGLTSYSLYQNVIALKLGPISVTDYSKNLLTASIMLFAINDIVLLISLVYALALFIRLVVEGCKKYDDKPASEKRYYRDDRYLGHVNSADHQLPPPDRRSGDIMDDVRVLGDVGDSRY